MSRYPSESIARFDQQFAETPAERNEARREFVHKRAFETLWRLIADLSGGLTDEGPDWSNDGLHALRERVANALPPTVRPDWLLPYCNPAIHQSAPKADAGKPKAQHDDAPSMSHLGGASDTPYQDSGYAHQNAPMPKWPKDV